MSELLIEAQYTGTCSYWALLIRSGTVMLDRHEHFIKRSYRNRAHILGANGLLRLSIPLERGKHQHASMKDIRISYNEPWQKMHWQSFCSAYRRSPYFEFYEQELRPFYEDRWELLFDFNADLLKRIEALLKAEIKWECSDMYVRSPEKKSDKRSFILPGKYPVQLKRYAQVFSDRFEFENDLSVLDLLFNLGPQSYDYLMDIKF
jgi:hypothetical protein